MKFSVIVPVYKVEKYLSECIESILSQSFQDFELLLVDDGSPDRCPAICDAYAAKNDRVHVYHQPNQGPSAARNRGLSASQGEYVVFVDSDDVLCDESLEKAAACIEEQGNPDLVIGNILVWDGSFEQLRENSRDFWREASGKDILELNALYVKKRLQLPWEACHSVYRRKLLTDNSLLFQKGLTCAEDLDFYLRLIQVVKTYVLTNIALIKYRKRLDSIMNSPTFQSVWGQLSVFSNAVAQCAIFPDSALMRSYFANRYAKYVLWIVSIDCKDDQEKCYQFVEEHWEVLSFTAGWQYACAKVIWKILGIRHGSYLLNIGRVFVKRIKEIIDYSKIVMHKWRLQKDS